MAATEMRLKEAMGFPAAETDLASGGILGENIEEADAAAGGHPRSGPGPGPSNGCEWHILEDDEGYETEEVPYD